MKKRPEKGVDIPCLPSNAPLNDEQRQWLAGFLTGLNSRLLTLGDGAASASTDANLKPLTVIYGSQTGNCQAIAEDIVELAKTHGLSTTVIDMDEIDIAHLVNIERLLVITSTYGEGEMPDNAEALWQAINADNAPSFADTYFAVLALGDTNYDDFCLAGKQWDARLAALGGQRIAERVDCDIDFETLSNHWIATVLPIMATKGSTTTVANAASTAGSAASHKSKPRYNRKNPLQVQLIAKKTLTGAASSKAIIHYEFSLASFGVSYEAGDALNIMPRNRPDLVAALLFALGADGEQQESFNGERLPLAVIFTNHLEIRTPSKDFLTELARRTDDNALSDLLNADNNDALNDFLWGKDIIDLLKRYSSAQFSAREFIALSKTLAPRAYSISSSSKYHPDEVHLTVGNVHYHSDDREHHGVCSTFLADMVEVGSKVSCFFSPNKNFAVPDDGNAPMIMVGPGTGIAPFRAFLEERMATGAKGDNWLFFGDRNRASDFIYEDEIVAMQASGLLTRLDVAFSRDQQEKIYVQHRMHEHGAELFAWLERGGYFFVCGDAYRMAKDVDHSLHQVVSQHGQLSEAEALTYIKQLKKEKRYVRDVY